MTGPSNTRAPGILGSAVCDISYWIMRREPEVVTAKAVSSYTGFALMRSQVPAVATSFVPFQQIRVPLVVPSTEVMRPAPVIDLLILGMTRTHFQFRTGLAA